jgi:hypothetical protein
MKDCETRFGVWEDGRMSKGIHMIECGEEEEDCLLFAA